MVGRPAEIEVERFEFDSVNLAHLKRHGVSEAIVLAVRARAPRYFLNLPGRAGSHVMIGPEDNNQYFYIVLNATAERGKWRPITGWQLGRRALRLYGRS